MHIVLVFFGLDVSKDGESLLSLSYTNGILLPILSLQGVKKSFPPLKMSIRY